MGDGPPGFRRNSSCSAVLRILLGVFQISSTGFLPSLTDFSKSFDYLKKLPQRSPTTPTSKLVGLGCSRFARRYSGNRFFFLFLQVLRCFSSLRLPHLRVTAISCWVPPFGNLWILAYLQLPKAYRCSSRPSSAPSAKAFTVRPLFLNHIFLALLLLFNSVFLQTRSILWFMI